jgi:hypothetical protein
MEYSFEQTGLEWEFPPISEGYVFPVVFFLMHVVCILSYQIKGKITQEKKSKLKLMRPVLFFMELGFGLWTLCLQSRYSTTWATPPVQWGLDLTEILIAMTWTMPLFWDLLLPSPNKDLGSKCLSSFLPTLVVSYSDSLNYYL